MDSRSLMYSLAAKVQTNSEKKTTKLYFHTQVFTGDPKNGTISDREVEMVFLPKLQTLRRFFVKTGLFLKQFHSLTAVADDVDTRRKLVTSGAIDVIVR